MRWILPLSLLTGLATAMPAIGHAETWCIRDSAGITSEICAFSSADDCIRAALVGPSGGIICAQNEAVPPRPAGVLTKPRCRVHGTAAIGGQRRADRYAARYLSGAGSRGDCDDRSQPQIELLDQVVVVERFGGSAFEGDLAVHDHITAVGDADSLREILLRHQYRKII